MRRPRLPSYPQRVLAAVGGWWLYPETKGLSFEKVDELYAMNIPARHFRRAAEEAGIGRVVGDLKGMENPNDGKKSDIHEVEAA